MSEDFVSFAHEARKRYKTNLHKVYCKIVLMKRRGGCLFARATEILSLPRPM